MLLSKSVTVVILMTVGLAVSDHQWATIGQISMNKMNSETLPGNLLPNFLFMQGAIEGGSVGVNIGGGRGNKKPFMPDDTCTDDIWEGAMEDMRSPQLPYLTQDLWTCARTIEVFTPKFPLYPIFLSDSPVPIVVDPRLDDGNGRASCHDDSPILWQDLGCVRQDPRARPSLQQQGSPACQHRSSQELGLWGM